MKQVQHEPAHKPAAVRSGRTGHKSRTASLEALYDPFGCPYGRPELLPVEPAIIRVVVVRGVDDINPGITRCRGLKLPRAQDELREATLLDRGAWLGKGPLP